MKTLILLFSSIVLFQATSSAGVLLDPYVGYAVSGNNGGSSVTGYDAGLRLGLSNLGLGAGVDVTLAGKYSYKNSTTSTTDDGKPLHTGVFVSYDFPVLVRGYATYFINSKVTTDTATITGNGTKLGIQYTGLPLVAVGIELYTMKYTEVETAGIKVSTSGSETQTRIAISIPIVL